MTTTLLLLAAFLAIVVVGATLVAVYDAAERLWAGDLEAAATPIARRRSSAGRTARARPPRTPVVAWPHLH
jgi:hypothetical protein